MHLDKDFEHTFASNICLSKIFVEVPNKVI